jgi:hypothetical protein
MKIESSNQIVLRAKGKRQKDFPKKYCRQWGFLSHFLRLPLPTKFGFSCAWQGISVPIDDK